jgi:hypothetical protein
VDEAEAAVYAVATVETGLDASEELDEARIGRSESVALCYQRARPVVERGSVTDERSLSKELL